MSEVDILRAAIYVLTGIATTIGGALILLVVWAAKGVIKSIDELRIDIRTFDRRITRLEAKNFWQLKRSEDHKGAA
jgi:hypothetical protein